MLLKLPYQNNGTQTASGVSFLIDPPQSVNLLKAEILLDASVSAAGGPQPADCETATTGDENSVSCVGPDAAVGASSELSLSITVQARKGVHPVRVTISTTSAEGNAINNTVEALLTSAGAGDTPDDNSDGGGIVARVGARRGPPPPSRR